MINDDWRMTFAEESDGELSHYGKKGMKWGVRRAQNSALNKASRAADRKEHSDKVQTARDRVKSGANKADFKAAKADAKSRKMEIGSREVRKAISKARNQRYDEIQTSQKYKNGKELVAGALVSAAALTLFSLAKNQ